MDVRLVDGLAQHMQRVLEIIAEGRGSLALPEATRWKALALLRWQMLHALETFIDYKERLLLDPLIARSDTAIARRAAAIKRSNRSLWSAYGVFVDRWAIRSPLSVDENYSVEARKMATRIEQTVIADVQALEELARGVDR